MHHINDTGPTSQRVLTVLRFGLCKGAEGAIAIHQCCAGMELHKRLKVDTSREAR